MSQNPQINTPTENNQTFYSDGSKQVIQQPNRSYDNPTVTSDNSLPVLYGTMPMTYVDSTSQSYPTMPGYDVIYIPKSYSFVDSNVNLNCNNMKST